MSVSARKRFSRSLFDANDAIAKMSGMVFLFDHGATFVSGNRNQYGVDLLYKHPVFEDEERMLECEIKHTWKGGPFPYSTINVLERKSKYFTAGADLFLLSGNKQDYLTINAEDVLGCPTENVANKYVWEGELFYKVPISLAHFGRFREPIVVPDNLYCLSCDGLAFERNKKKQFVCKDCGESL